MNEPLKGVEPLPWANALAIACLNNEKQMGLANIMYAQEFKVYPGAIKVPEL